MPLGWPMADGHQVTCQLLQPPTALPGIWSFCQGTTTLLSLLAWVILSRGIWPHQLLGIGKDCSLVAPNELGSSWGAVGGSRVALLSEGAGRPMGASPTLLLRPGRLRHGSLSIAALPLGKPGSAQQRSHLNSSPSPAPFTALP